MRLNNYYLFIIPTLIWGSTWYAIKFQLGTVNPLVSVGYRFAIAGIVLLLICKILKFNLKILFGMIALKISILPGRIYLTWLMI